MKRFIPIILFVFFCCAFFGSPKVDTTSDKDFRNSIIEMLDSLKPDNREELAKSFSLILTNGKSETDITLTAPSAMRLGCSLQDVYTLCEQNAQWGNKTYLNTLNSLDGLTFDELRKRAAKIKNIFQAEKAKKEAEWQKQRLTQFQQKLVKIKSSINDIKEQEKRLKNGQSILTASQNYADKINLKSTETPIKERTANFASSLKVDINLTNNGVKTISYIRFKTTVNDTKEKRIREYFNEIKFDKPIGSGHNFKKTFVVERIAWLKYPPQGVKITTVIDQLVTADCYNLVINDWKKRFSGEWFYKDAERVTRNKKKKIEREQNFLVKHKQWLEKTLELIEAKKIKNKDDEYEQMGFEPSYVPNNNF